MVFSIRELKAPTIAGRKRCLAVSGNSRFARAMNLTGAELLRSIELPYFQSVEAAPVRTSFSITEPELAKLAADGTYDCTNNSKLYFLAAKYLALRGAALDVGASSNELPAKGLLDAGLTKVIMLDHVYDAANAEKRNSARSNKRLSETKGEALALPFAPNTFAAIVFNQSLCFIHEYSPSTAPAWQIIDQRMKTGSPETMKSLLEVEKSPYVSADLSLRSLVAVYIALEEALRTLKPGGYVLIKTGSHIHGYRIGNLGLNYEHLLKEVGFTSVKVLFHPEDGSIPVFAFARKS